MAFLVDDGDFLVDEFGNFLLDEFGAHTLTLTQATGGNATVTPEQEGYDDGEFATLAASPSPTYSFIFWSLNGQRFHANPLNINVNQDLAVEPYFALTTPPTPTPSPMGGARCPFCKGGERCPVCGGTGWVR